MTDVYCPSPNYYEGILQLRGDHTEVLDWVLNTVKKDQRAYITKAKKVKGGIDLYITSQRYLRSLGKKIKQTFVGEFKETRTLHTRDKNSQKELYRITILFRPYPIKKGEKIKYKGEEYELVNFSNQIKIKNIKTGKTKYIKQEELKHCQF